MHLTIHNLPTEIVESILVSSLPEVFRPQETHLKLGESFQDFIELKERVRQRAPNATYSGNERLDLMLTCRYWHNILKGSALFWSFLELDTGKTINLHLMANMIQWSGDHPLNLVVTFSKRISPDGLLVPICVLIQKTFRRLRSIAILSPDMDPYAITTALFPTNCPARLPVLEHLYTFGGRLAFTYAPSAIGSIHAPRLKSFMIPYFFSFLWMTLHPESLSRIIRLLLNFYPGPTVDAISLLSQCVNLEALGICGGPDYPVFPQGGTHMYDFRFPRLKCLDITLNRHTGDHEIMNKHFYAPELSTLTLRFEGHCPSVDLSHFFQRHPQIEGLCLCGYTFRFGDITGISPYLSALKRVIFKRCRESTLCVLAFLSRPQSTHFIAPGLQSFEIDQVRDDILDAVILDLIKSRIHLGVKFSIRHVHVAALVQNELERIEKENSGRIELKLFPW